MSYIERSFLFDNAGSSDFGDGSYLKLPRQLNKSQVRPESVDDSGFGVVGLIVDDPASFRSSSSIEFILDQDGEPIKVVDACFSVGRRVVCAGRPRVDANGEIASIRALRQLGVTRVLSVGRADLDQRKYLRFLGVDNAMAAEFIDLSGAPEFGVGANASTCPALREFLETSAVTEGCEVLSGDMQAAFSGVSANVGVVVRELGLCYGALRYASMSYETEDLDAIALRILDEAVNSTQSAPACDCGKLDR